MANYNFTGNPFVDTGLNVLVARARESGLAVDTLQELTPQESSKPWAMAYGCAGKPSPQSVQHGRRQ